MDYHIKIKNIICLPEGSQFTFDTVINTERDVENDLKNELVLRYHTVHMLVFWFYCSIIII